MTKPLFTVSLTAAAVAVLLATGCAQPSSSDRTDGRQSSNMQRSADPTMGLGRVASQDQRTAEMDDNPTPGQSPTPAPSTTTAGNISAPMADASGSARTDVQVTPGAPDNSPAAAPSGQIGTHPATDGPATPNAGTMPSSPDTMSPSGTMPSSSGSTTSNTSPPLPTSDGRNSNTDAYRSGTTPDSSNQRGSSAMTSSGTADAPTAPAYGDNESTMRSARTDRN